MQRNFRFVTVSVVSALALFSSAVSFATPEQDSRIWEAKQVMTEVMMTPEQSIPEELLAKCKAIAIYPNVLKAGFILGGRFGRGVVLKKDENTGKWGPVAFSTIGGGSYGLQIGGSATDLILVVMNERGLNGLLSNNFTLGGDVAVAAGPVGRNSEAATDLSLRAGIISYSRSRGLFAGMALDGAILTQDNNSNTAYYGKYVTSRDILLSHAVEVQPSSKDLIQALTEYSTRWDKRVASKAAAAPVKKA